MNIIVTNKQKEIIDNANIDAIKDLNGLFNVDDLISKLRNYFFSRVILDATSVISFPTQEVLEKLANGIGADRLVILLPATPEPPREFVERLVSLKIYNFSNKIDDVIRFINRPNTYNDVKGFVSTNNVDFYVDNSIKEDNVNNGFNNTNLELNNRQESYTDEELNVDDDFDEFDNKKNMDISQSNISNIPLNTLNNGFNNGNINSLENMPTGGINNGTVFLNSNVSNNGINKRIIGIKNITEHAGSTTLTYLLTKMAINNLHKKVLAVEVNKNDFSYYQDPNMISVVDGQLENTISNKNYDIIFIDLNDCQNMGICNDIIYLVEPSIIKLNKLMAMNRNIFKELAGKKIILNKSLLNESDVTTFSNEAGMSMFYNLKPLNDRLFNDDILKLLHLLGIN